MPTGPVFFNYYFCEAQIMVGRVYTTFYLPLLKIASILLKNEVYAILDIDFDFKRVLKPQQLLYFHPKTQAPL